LIVIFIFPMEADYVRRYPLRYRGDYTPD